MRGLLLSLALAATVITAGCTPAVPDVEDRVPQPKRVSFKGSLDPKFVGNWKSPKETSCLDLHSDGTAGISSKVPTPRGIQNKSLTGKWLVSGNSLLLQYTDSNHDESTLEYPAKFEGNKMTLIQGSSLKTVYTRS